MDYSWVEHKQIFVFDDLDDDDDNSSRGTAIPEVCSPPGSFLTAAPEFLGSMPPVPSYPVVCALSPFPAFSNILTVYCNDRHETSQANFSR